MKTHIRIVLMVAIVMIVFSVAAFAGDDIRLQLDGQIIKTDVPPIIEKGRTLIPYRALLESMGAEVYWEKEANMATAILGSHRVQVTIDSKTAFVNGTAKEMDVPPRIIGSRTMIPLRFVLENLDCKVDWDNDTRTVIIESPQNNGPTVVKKIEYVETDAYYSIVVKASDVIKGTRVFSYSQPERYGIDIENALLPDMIGTIAAENQIFNNVRFSQFDKNTVRIVVDLNEKTVGKLSLSEDRSTLNIDFEKMDVDTGGNGGGPKDDPGNNEDDFQGILPELDWRATGKLIAIDAGHGGSDPGASGKINGRTVINEKDLNLDIALRLHQLLDYAGANVVLLRDKDVSMALYSRPEAANSMNADLLVSIHNNSATSSAANGAEVLYYDKVGTEQYGIKSKDLAACINNELIKELSLKNRGIKNSPHLAVLNKSLMPAVIIEGGFLSNQGDLQVMLTEEFRESYAVATARGIIKALNTWADKHSL